MRQSFEAWVHQCWYPAKQQSWYYSLLIGILLPFSLLYRLFLPVRQFFLRYSQQKSAALPPVCVVGNITVGGTGKTPFVIFFAKLLKENGFTPGVVSRGYAGNKSKHDIITLNETTGALLVGEEPLLIYQKTGCPVVVGCKRNKAILQLHTEFPEVDIIISDDGLQHYAMKRTIEIALLDAKRMCGNGFCLPAGPLREPMSRLNKVDYLILKETEEPQVETNLPNIHTPVFSMLIQNHRLYSLTDHTHQQLVSYFQGQTVHAVAGIANPQSFFNMLRAQGLVVIEHVFHDHYFYHANDFIFKEKYPIIMTEKDALKCLDIAKENSNFDAWVLPIEAKMPNSFCQHILGRLQHG